MSLLRAPLRLLLGVCLVTGLLARVRLEQRLRGVCLRTAARRGRRASARLNRLLGVEVRLSGRIPDGVAVFVANHRSYIDIPAIMACVDCTFLAKHEMSRWPIFGCLARSLHTVFVDRECKESRRAARQKLGELLDRGQPVALFPEGTTTRGPGCLPFQPGMFFTAAERGLPVVPVALHYEYLEDAWVDDDTLLRHFFDRFRRRRMRLHVGFGPALEHSDGAALQRAAEVWIAESIERFSRGWQLGEAADRREGGEHGDGQFVPGGVPLPAG